jgi:hypothetical protein
MHGQTLLGSGYVVVPIRSPCWLSLRPRHLGEKVDPSERGNSTHPKHLARRPFLSILFARRVRTSSGHCYVMLSPLPMLLIVTCARSSRWEC